MGLGELFSLLSAAAWALGVIIYKRLGESLSPLALNLWKNALVLALLLPTAWLLQPADAPALTGRALWISVASGALGIALADTLYFRALNELGAGRMGIIGNLFSPFVIVLAWAWLGERLAWIQVGGFVLVLSGVLLVHAADTGRGPAVTRKGLLLGIAAVLLNAVSIVLIKPVLETAPFFSVAILRMAGALLLMLALWPWLRGASRMPSWRELPWRILLPGALVGQYLAMLCWLAGYKYIPASVASILNETASIFILLFAAWLLHERLSARRLLGVALSFGGVALMLWA